MRTFIPTSLLPYILEVVLYLFGSLLQWLEPAEIEGETQTDKWGTEKSWSASGYFHVFSASCQYAQS